jgi:cyclohexa-1,5-dienecarbonyl-CoA hydratase
MLSVFHDLLRQIASYPTPVACLVQGSCLGGGFELALCCHLVFAGAGAVFACPEIKLGVLPPVLAALGPLRLGSALAERLLLTGGSLPAASPEATAFVAQVFAGEDPEQPFLRWYRENMRPLSAFAIRQATHAVRFQSQLAETLDSALARVERQYVEEVLSSHDGNEGISAFLDDRSPAWKDE